MYLSNPCIPSMHVRLGEADLTSNRGMTIPISPWQVTDHPEYKRGRSYYDVSLIYLENSLEYNEVIQPICLPELADADRDSHENEFVRLLGESHAISSILPDSSMFVTSSIKKDQT